MENDSTVFVSFARTPMGNLLGDLKEFPSPALGATVIKAAYQRAGLDPSSIDEVLLGCVLPAGVGQAPPRQAARAAELPDKTPCTMISKVCGSGMKAIMFAHLTLQTHAAGIVIAGGMESMTNAPYLLKKARQGYRLGRSEIDDHMVLDGLEDAYTGQSMGFYADQCAKQYGFTRQQQDEYALVSFERARSATRNKLFAAEIVPLSVKTKEGEKIIIEDQRPFSVNLERITQLQPAFVKDGTVTAGNSSAIADGAAALAMMRLSTAKKEHIKPIARIVGQTNTARHPSEFTIAPIDTINQLLKVVGWNIGDVDLFEINEAFAVVVLAAMHDLKIPLEKINIHGGACALGHPIGASGARIVVTLIAALKQAGLQRGIAALCIGGGEATGIAIEMM
ncbi:MAG: acetyl-CoA C-acyltransferase [Gammaproteobacteria bacterium]|nr:acetyl-CoA C-acyltransferase [Gammaproteobacteria bacterium]